MDTLPRSERVRGKTAVSALMSKGRWGVSRDLKYCYLRNDDQDGTNRVMVSVPKRLFKRAVKRNLLKRRLREAYRTRKYLLAPSSTDILLLYNTKEVKDFTSIREEVEAILQRISNERQL